MTSARSHRPRSPWRSPRSWSLRGRLLAALLALLAVVCLVVGSVSVVALNQFLIGRLDDQLIAAGQRSQAAFDEPRGHRPGDVHGSGPDFLLAPGQGQGTLGAKIVAGQATEAAVLDQNGQPQPIDTSQVTLLAGTPTDGQPHTRDLGADLGSYRLLAQQAPDGDIIVTGLPLAGVHAAVYRLAAVTATISLLALLIAGFVGGVIIRFALQPLHRVAGTAARVTELALDRGQVALTERVTPADADPRTEVGQVGAGLNSMLSHVATALAAREASETRVRRFVADASHELRTPLAAIRGYAELTRSSPDPVPPDVARALTRIESQADRMSDLVQDLLMLARLDAGRVDDHVQVDLSRLVLEAVDDARAAGDAHHWRLELPDEPVLVRGSQATLRQVVDNLLNNARMHTPPGTTVRTGIRYEPFETRSAPGPATVTLHVTDDGPGIRPELIPDLFERFSRGDTSRSRASGSTGLGLAIVAAIVQAHGGLVFVRSADGTTSFTVRLPAWRPHPYSDAQNRVARGDRQYAPNSH